MTKMAGGEFNRTEFNPEYEFNCGKFKRVVGKKTFFPICERKSARKSTRLKLVFSTSRKVRRNWKKVPVQNFISKKYGTVISTIKDVKEHNEGVKIQIKEIKEDINKLGNDGFNVGVKLDELE